MMRRWRVRMGAGLVLALTAGLAVSVTAQDAVTPPTSLDHALPVNAAGPDIYRAACQTCHGTDGKGTSPALLGFPQPLPNGHDLPDFTDCATNTAEPLADWVSVAARGGRVRALDRHMPAFEEALSLEQLSTVVAHLRTFCTDSHWPHAEMNVPRAFFTEKAFPENELVWNAGLAGTGGLNGTHNLVYEHRLGARGQLEARLPFGQRAHHHGVQGLAAGDLELTLRRVLYSSTRRGSIFAAGAAVTLPTGSTASGLGNGFAVYEPLAMWTQLLGPAGFLQLHGGYEIPSDGTTGQREAFFRTAVGLTVVQDHSFGRSWSPMVEVLYAKPSRGTAEWDVVPQMQVSLSKLQHVLLSVGVRTPVSARQSRDTQVLTYVVWDWFDGGLFRFWR
ncbi:MAG: cytochrome c [Vicinamibacterales bacterium]|nr:cytochrome c [Vicinamibacterales bacterium]